MDEQLDNINIETEISQAWINLSWELLENIDQTVPYILNTVRKKIEGPIRNIPFSYEKEKRRSELIFFRNTD